MNANLQQTIAAADRIFEMLDTHTEVAESPSAEPMPPSWSMRSIPIFRCTRKGRPLTAIR